jgi:hypothetical protein
VITHVAGSSRSSDGVGVGVGVGVGDGVGVGVAEADRTGWDGSAVEVDGRAQPVIAMAAMSSTAVDADKRIYSLLRWGLLHVTGTATTLVIQTRQS